MRVKFIFGTLFLSLILIVPVSAKSTWESAKSYFQNRKIEMEVLNKPQSFMKRGDFVKLLMLDIGYQIPPTQKLFPQPFLDLPQKGEWTPYISKAYKSGLLTKQDYFRPNQPIKRIDAFRLVLQAQGFSIPLTYDKLVYKDLISLEHKRIANKIMQLGIYQPTGNLFKPNAFLKTEEAAILIYQFALLEESDQSLMEKEKPQTSRLKNIEYLESVNQQIKNKYYRLEKVDEGKLMDGALEGYVKKLDDPYSVYFPPQENADFNVSLEGNFEGIGAYLEETDQGIIIQSPISGSPAEKAGLQAGDLIIKVDGKEVNKMKTSDITKLIKGPAGTLVKISILRQNQELNFEITRQHIEIPALKSEWKGDILLITFSSFSSRADTEFADLIQKAKLEKPNFKGVIVDLRNNPGGFLDVVEKILPYWVPEAETLVQLKYRNSTEIDLSPKNQLLTNTKTAIIQNKSSASASEILAGTLKDYQKARIFGETSFGKGTVQEIIQYNNGSALKITVAEWLTGKGNSINGTGVKADEEIVNNPNTLADEVLDAALNWINR
ncbi:MAG TPA: S41 family peptidase [Candidatus Gracilibacteria bacterium]|nr:S41 family peptidase [Candidatus Gracilibacteria bacterium]